MTTAANWGANGASLEDCHSNIFSLVQYHSIIARHRHASQCGWTGHEAGGGGRALLRVCRTKVNPLLPLLGNHYRGLVVQNDQHNSSQPNLVNMLTSACIICKKKKQLRITVLTVTWNVSRRTKCTLEMP